MHHFRGAAPTNLQEISQILSTNQDKIAFISGGTDLVIKIRNSLVVPNLVVDISQIPELKGIEGEGEEVKIGSAVPFSIISSHPLLVEKTPGLVQAAAQVGSVQIRNRGTLGGNIAGHAPAADTIPPLLTLDASLTLLGSKGMRRISLSHFLLERREEKSAPTELITKIGFPLPPQGSKGAFVKVGARSSVTKAKISMAALVHVDTEKNMIRTSRIAVGALGKNAFRLKECENFLFGRYITPLLMEEFSYLLIDIVERTIEGRASLPYKRVAVRGLAYDLFTGLWPAVFPGRGDAS